MRSPSVRLQSSMRPLVALEETQLENGNVWPVFEEERFLGMVSHTDLERAASEGVASVRPIVHSEHFPHVHSDHTLDVVLHRTGATGLRTLPVVSRSDIRRLEGIVTIEDVLKVSASRWNR